MCDAARDAACERRRVDATPQTVFTSTPRV
jgi:hypothetical protein